MAAWERAELDQLIAAGTAPAPKLTRAWILLKADQSEHGSGTGLSGSTRRAAVSQPTAARLVFASVEIADDRVVAVVPQSDFAPFFVARATADGPLPGHDDGTGEAVPSSEVMKGR